MNENLDNMPFEQLVPTNSNYLKKDDVGEDGVILTIRGFAHETIKDENGQPEQKVVLHFVEQGYKPMVVNSTNAQLLKIATGCLTAGEARGKRVVVYNDPNVSFGGKVTGGLRIKRIPGPPAQPRQPQQAGRPGKTQGLSMTTGRPPEPPPFSDVPADYSSQDDVEF